VSASRVFLWIISGLSLIGGVILLLSALALNAAKDSDELADDSQFQSLVDQSSGLLWFMTFIAFVWTVASIVLAIKFKTGGSGLRTALIVYGALTIVLGLYPFGGIVGIVHIVLSILLIVFVSKADGAAWFKRPVTDAHRARAHLPADICRRTCRCACQKAVTPVVSAGFTAFWRLSPRTVADPRQGTDRAPGASYPDKDSVGEPWSRELGKGSPWPGHTTARTAAAALCTASSSCRWTARIPTSR